MGAWSIDYCRQILAGQSKPDIKDAAREIIRLRSSIARALEVADETKNKGADMARVRAMLRLALKGDA